MRSFSRSRIGNLTILFVLGLVIIQPSRFEVVTKKSISSSLVYAQVTEKGNGNEEDGSVKFDMFIPGSNEEGEIVYEVEPGDTLSEIAKTFGTTTSILLDNNTIADPNNLSNGQKIVITNDGGEVIYEVQESMPVKEFASTYDIELAEVVELNYLESSDVVLEQGQQLFLNLTREQAELKDLRQTPEYVRPA